MYMEEFNFKKKFGQNFLKNKAVIGNIAKCGDVLSNSLIIEVGPGSGSLTVEMAKLYPDSNILAYEIDETLEDIIYDNTHEFKNINIKFADFLKCDLNKDIAGYSFDNLYFISNVPYYITTPILFKLIDSNLPFEKIVMMVQKEVGDRFSSKVSCKNYGALTVILNYYFEIKKEFLVDRNQFVPRPNVDSVVVSFKRKKNQDAVDKDKFIKLVHDSFKFKRKMLRNNLKDYDLDKISKVLEKYGYDLSIRAEALDYKVFVEIANSL